MSEMLRHWCDSELHGFEWSESGRDVTITMSDAVITCRWAESFDVRLATPVGRGGRLLCWEGEIRKAENERYEVAFDFASEGHLRLTCAEVEVSPRPDD